MFKYQCKLTLSVRHIVAEIEALKARIDMLSKNVSPHDHDHKGK
jgi:hypothetical protein